MSNSKKIILSAVIIILIVGFGAYYYFWKQNKAKQQIMEMSVPESVVEAAKNYIISKVGEDYFSNNYKLLSESWCWADGNINRCGISFDYLPLNQLYEQHQVVHVYIFKDDVRVYGDSGIFDCLNKKELCEFNIKKEEALTIASSNGFDINSKDFEIKIATSSFKGYGQWVWRVTNYFHNIIGKNGCGTAKSMDIDLSAGGVSDIREQESCPVNPIN